MPSSSSFRGYILDEGLGYHADRARGPFLQAVANGVTLNLLGLVALNSFRRKRLRGVLALLFLVALPLAIVATKTRAVWLSFALSILALLFFSPSRRLRRACLCFVLAGILGLAAVVTFADRNTSLSDRLEERGPVIFRMADLSSWLGDVPEEACRRMGRANMQTELSKEDQRFSSGAVLFSQYAILRSSSNTGSWDCCSTCGS